MSSVSLFVYNHYNIVIIIKYPNPMLQLIIKCVICKKMSTSFKVTRSVYGYAVFCSHLRTRKVGVSSRNVDSRNFPHFSQSMLTPMITVNYNTLCCQLAKPHGIRDRLNRSVLANGTGRVL